MTTWFKKNLGDGILTHNPCVEIKEMFQASAEAINIDDETAVFVKQISDGQLHCEVIAYFSPASADIAQAFNAEPCNKPLSEKLTLLAGNENSRKVLFSEDN